MEYSRSEDQRKLVLDMGKKHVSGRRTKTLTGLTRTTVRFARETTRMSSVSDRICTCKSRTEYNDKI